MRLACPAILFPVCHVERKRNISEFSRATPLSLDQRFFSRDCGIRMTATLSAPSTAAKNSSQDSANELPADLAAGSAHRTLGH